MSLLSKYDTLIANAISQNVYSNIREYSQVFRDAPAQPSVSTLNQYNDKNTFAPIASTFPGTGIGGFDVFAIAHWARAIGQEFGALGKPGQTTGERGQNIAKGASFLATQFLLATFNPGDLNVGGLLNQVYNPLHLPLAAVPLIRGATTIGSPNAAAALSVTGEVYSQASLAAPDRMLLLREGAYKKVISATDLAQLNTPKLQALGDVALQGRSLLPVHPVSVQGQVDQEGPYSLLAAALPVHKNIYTPNNKYSDGPAIDLAKIEDTTKLSVGPLKQTAEDVKLSALFAKTPVLGPVQYSWIANARLTAGKYGINVASFPDNVSVKFPYENNGVVAESNAISDDANYMPFFFQDLRDSPPSLLYFRAFLHDGLEENFSPTWNTQNYYGRVDDIPTYQNTTRTIALSFDLVAWGPEDLQPMYLKLHKLQSMVYPMFDSHGYIQAGPLLRLRVGDLISAAGNSLGSAKKGLPGYINTMTFSYDDGIWNLNTDFKVPRKVTVSLGFTVVHEGNPGIYPFQSYNITTNETIPSTTGPIFGTLNPPLANGNENVSAANIRGVAGTVFNQLPTNSGDLPNASAPNDAVNVTPGNIG